MTKLNHAFQQSPCLYHHFQTASFWSIIQFCRKLDLFFKWSALSAYGWSIWIKVDNHYCYSIKDGLIKLHCCSIVQLYGWNLYRKTSIHIAIKHKINWFRIFYPRLYYDISTCHLISTTPFSNENAYIKCNWSPRRWFSWKTLVFAFK